MNPEEVVTVCVLGAVVSPLLLGLMRGIFYRRVYQQPSVRWFIRPSNRPIIYLLRSSADPNLFKIGYTARKIERRAGEIADKFGAVEIIGWMRMPHAYAAEQSIHYVMQSQRGVESLGNEWYRTQKRGGEKQLIAIIRRESLRTKWLAILRMSWPFNADMGWHQAAS